MNKKALSWVFVFVAVSLVNTAAAPAAPRKTAPRRTTTAASSATPRAALPTPSTVRKTAYSAVRSQARKARLARARSIATTREMASTMLPRYKTDENGALVPDLRAEAAVIYDPVTGQVLWEQNAQTQRSIASITKVMTATVVLEDDPDLSQQVTIAKSDVYQASTTYLKANDVVTVDDLLHLLLIPSDNGAARALARVSPYGSEGFVRRMNEKASELGLVNTNYADPSGLLSDNLSSAYDMARLITHASNDERIASIMRTPEYTFRTAKGRLVAIHSTDRLLGSELDVRAAKTGFISKAGYCLATLLRLPEGSQFAVVVLGARSNAGRFMETKNLFQWLSTQASTFLGTAPTPAPAAAAATAPAPVQ